MISLLLPILMQVGPAPTPLHLPALPIPRKSVEVPEQRSVPSKAQAAAQEAIAGNRAIVAGNYDQAVDLLRAARVDATAAGDTQLAAGIALDEVRAMFLLGRFADAVPILAEARTALPGNADAWVASAVAARKTGDLASAQRLIEEAAAFAPGDPSVGLEAGLVAYYGQRPEAARKSWESVVALAPDSDEAGVARQYLQALGTEAAQ